MRKFIVYSIIIIIIQINSCNPQKIPIGVSINLSGIGGKASEDIRDGALLAIRKVNQSGGIKGRQLVLYLSDDKNSPEGAIESDRGLINEDVYAIIGHTSSDNTLAAVPLTNRHQTVLISAYTATSRLSNKDDFFIRTSIDTNYYGKAISWYLKKNKIKKVTIVKDISNKSYVNDISSIIKKNYLHSLKSISFHSQNKRDLNQALSSINLKEKSFYILLTEASMTALLTQKIKQKNPLSKILATTWAQNLTLFQYGGKYVNNLEIISFIRTDLNSPDISEFDSEFYTMFKRNAGARAHRAYELVQILSQALKECNFCHGKELKRTIIKNKYDTILGKVYFNQYGDTNRPIYLLKAKDNQFITLQEIKLNELPDF